MESNGLLDVYVKEREEDNSPDFYLINCLGGGNFHWDRKKLKEGKVHEGKN